MRGAAEAPPIIRRALQSPSSNQWSESGRDLGGGAIGDAGDVDCTGKHPRDAIEQATRKVLATAGLPISLGGDHSITYPVMRSVRAARKKLTILHIDAHADLYDEFEGDRFSHACPFARIMEEGLADRLVQVGLRTLTGHQRDQVKRFGVEVIDMIDWTRGRRPDVGRHPVYLSLDLDALDPAFAPGVSHWEPGGLSVRDVIGIIHSVDAPLVGADVVELNPARDPSGVTAMVAAKFVKEIAAQMLDQRALELD